MKASVMVGGRLVCSELFAGRTIIRNPDPAAGFCAFSEHPRFIGGSACSSPATIRPISRRKKRPVSEAGRQGLSRMTTPIHASALRIGMFVHLNVGWMSHPFPLSSFKLTSDEQIETIRSLGLSRLTWSPERSDVEQPAADTVAAASAPEAVDPPVDEAAPRPLDAR